MDNIFQQGISQQVWFETYKWETDKTPYDMWRRISKDIAKVEKTDELREKWEAKFYDLLFDFKFVPGGRVMSNAGTGLKSTTYVNCFVKDFPKGGDSIDGIMEVITKQAKILASEGGYGINFSMLRPKGSYVSGIGVETSGTLEFMNIADITSTTLTKGSGRKAKKGKNKIRKGAMMGVLDISHPSIEEFIVAKQQAGVLSKFNLSVGVTDEFMKAVENHEKWDLIFPDTTFEKYDDEWDGVIKHWTDKNYPINVWKTFDDANELWDLILKSTYNRAEPGIIFLDTVNKFNNLYYREHISASNPCGEQFLADNGSCVLGAFNFTQFLNKNKTDYDYDKFKKYIPVAVRFLDNVNDATNFPLPEQELYAKENRRIGVGYMGYGSSLYMLKLAYGSKKALKITQDILNSNVNKMYQASSDIAIEKGSFPNLEIDKYLESAFIKQTLTKETTELIKKQGIRNALITTIAPTGNSGITANNVSGGLEPVISHNYTRTIIVNHTPKNLSLPKNIIWGKSFDSDSNWKWIKEGDEDILKIVLDKTVYKFDRNRGLTKEEDVSDYAVINMNDFDPKADYSTTLFDLGIEEHISTMKVFQKHVCNAISKTVNLPNDYPYENFKSVYMDAWKSGLKGMTTYRMGTMTSVVAVKNDDAENENVDDIQVRKSPKRPESLHCHVYKLKIKGEDWVVFIGVYKDYPFEVFAGKELDVALPSFIKDGNLIKVGSGKYAFSYKDEILIKDVKKLFENKEQEALTRQISLNLRHGTPLKYILEQLSKSHGNIGDFNKAITRALKKYIKEEEKTGAKCPNCDSETMYVEGCETCRNCGWSKCG